MLMLVVCKILSIGHFVEHFLFVAVLFGDLYAVFLCVLVVHFCWPLWFVSCVEDKKKRAQWLKQKAFRQKWEDIFFIGIFLQSICIIVGIFWMSISFCQWIARIQAYFPISLVTSTSVTRTHKCVCDSRISFIISSSFEIDIHRAKLPYTEHPGAYTQNRTVSWFCHHIKPKKIWNDWISCQAIPVWLYPLVFLLFHIGKRRKYFFFRDRTRKV